MIYFLPNPSPSSHGRSTIAATPAKHATTVAPSRTTAYYSTAPKVSVRVNAHIPVNECLFVWEKHRPVRKLMAPYCTVLKCGNPPFHPLSSRRSLADPRRSRLHTVQRRSLLVGVRRARERGISRTEQRDPAEVCRAEKIYTEAASWLDHFSRLLCRCYIA
jgi:hypothetical protein